MSNAQTALYLYDYIFPVVFALLPTKMDFPAARAMMLAIAGQESGFRARVQGGGGPAHGFGQFEKNGGVKEVLTSRVTRPILLPILKQLCYTSDVTECYHAITHNDVLAFVFIRLLLWKYPGALAQQDEMLKGYKQYLAAWRPGKPRPNDWPDNFTNGWQLVTHE